MDFCNEKTLSDLEWNRLLSAIAERCVGDAGKRIALSLPFGETESAIRIALDEVREAWNALEQGEPLPLYGLRDVQGAPARLQAGGVLAPQELREMAAMLASARMLRRYLAARRESMPALGHSCMTDPTLDRVEDELTQAFDPDGSLSDNASPRLRELRGFYRDTRTRMVSRLEELLRRYAPIVQENYWTEREGRYVLPVRADAHERFPGIVHTTSGSGATLFVEPRAVLPLGNRLKVLEGDVRREEEAIYNKLSVLLTDHLPSVIGAFQALSHADVRAASAKLTRDTQLIFVDLVTEPVVDLRGARHPLLVLHGAGVIASDLSAQNGKAIVISGPNAGGKTVALKSVGLAALMLRAGLPIACEPGSRMGVFDRVLTDVGDDQSLQNNLSTFSAHIKNIAKILESANARSLVLLDELATGTDPREGEALAAAVLDQLTSRGAAVMCTTHYEGLKVLAVADPRFTNASVGFDLATMSPTFQVVFGIPGGSSALAVARRFGISPLVLERAQSFLASEDRDFEQLVERLHRERQALELARAAAQDAERSAQARAQELQITIEKVRAKEASEITKETEALRGALRRAREELRAAQAKLRVKNPNAYEVREAEKVVNQVANKVAVGGELSQPPEEAFERPLTPQEIHRGLQVYVPRLRAGAEVTEVLSSGQLRVMAGPLKLTLAVQEVRAMRKGEKEGTPPRNPHKTLPIKSSILKSATPKEAIQTIENTCDLRGMRSDDAIRMAEQFLDRSLNENQQAVFFVHGHGTGALRLALRAMLTESTYVESFRPGEHNEGAEGVTVVRMR